MADGVYFVPMVGEVPARICFTLVEAKALKADYIDVFNKHGNKVHVLEFNQHKQTYKIM